MDILIFLAFYGVIVPNRPRNHLTKKSKEHDNYKYHIKIVSR